MFLWLDSRILITITVTLLLLSIVCQIIIGVLYQKMIKEADNMSTTDNKLLKQCKLKFANCYQLNMGVTNTPVFVDKFIQKITFGGVSLLGIGHLSGQFMMLSVLASGIGICKGIIEGNTIGELLPYYIISLFGLYVYFSITSLVDVSGKKTILKTNLVDYLENHMRKHLITEEAVAAVAAVEPAKEKMQQDKPSFFTKIEEEELEELLREFLA